MTRPLRSWRRLPALLVAAACLLSSVSPALAAASVSLADIEDEVMCVQCGRPLATSSGKAADDERQLIQGWIDAGLTKAQITQRLVDEYGERALVDDQSPIAAAAPWLAAVIGATSITLLLRHRRQRDQDGGASNDAPSVPDAPVRELSADDDARINAELAARD